MRVIALTILRRISVFLLKNIGSSNILESLNRVKKSLNFALNKNFSQNLLDLEKHSKLDNAIYSGISLVSMLL